MDLFDLAVKISVDSSGFNSGIAEAKQKMTTFGNNLQSMGSTLSRWGTTLTTAITLPVVGLATAAATTAVSFLQLKENTTTAFKTMLGSAEKATAMVEQLYDFAQSMPYSYQSYLEASKALVSMGISAENVIPYLTDLSDAAAATGSGAAGITTLSEAIGRMSSKGKVQLKELQIFTNMGVQAVNILGNEYGVTTEKIYDMMGKGELLTSEALPKLLDGMKNGTKGVNGMTAAYGGLAESMEGTLSGAIDTLSARWRDMSTKLFDSEKAYPVLTQLINNFAEAVKVVPKLLQGFTASITPALNNLNNKVKQFTDFISKADSTQLEKISKLILGLVAAGPVLLILGKFISLVGGIASGIGAVIPVISAFMGALGTLGGVMAALPIVGIGAALIVLVTQFEGFRDTVGKAFSKIGEAGMNFWNVISPVFNGLVSILETLGTVAIAGVLMAFDGLGKSIEWIAEALSPLTPAFESFEGAMSNMAKTFMSVFSPLVDTTTDFGDTVSESTANAINDFQELESKATTSLDELRWSGVAVTESTKNDILQKYKDLKDGVVKILDEQKNSTVALIKSAFEGTAITEEDKTKTIDALNKYYEAQKLSVEDGEKKIEEIMTKASNEKRALTTDEQNEILAIQANMQSAAVEALSKSKEEQLAILEKLKTDSGNVTAATAAEAVKNSKSQYDGVVKAANDEYDARMKAAALIKEYLPAEYASVATQLEEEAKKQKESVVSQAQEMHQKVVDEAKLQAGDHVNEINWETGEVKSAWQQMLEKAGSSVSEMTTGTSTGWQVMLDAITGGNSKIKTNWEETLNSMVDKGFLTNKDLEKMTSEQEQTMLDSWSKTDKNAGEKWAAIKKKITDNASTAETNASTSADDLQSNASSSFTSTEQVAAAEFKALSNQVSAQMTAAKTNTSTSTSTMENTFSGAVFSWPKIKTPHITVSPSGWTIGDILQGSFPSFSASWYAKGGILNSPTAFGINPYNNSLMIGGEAGPEAIAPIDKLQDYVRESVEEANRNSASKDTLNNIINLLETYLPGLANMNVVLSNGALVGGLSSDLDNSLGVTNALKARGTA